MADGNYTSRRQYLTQDELEEYADITVTDPTEADDQISHAEEQIDAYVGAQQKFVGNVYHGKLTAVNGTTLTDSSSDTPLSFDDNYFTHCEIEIIGGTGIGQRQIIASSNKNNKTITLRSAFATTPDTTSVYRIYQLGKFPRIQDCFKDSDTPSYYKYIPEAVKRATAAQVEFMIAMGADYFKTDSIDADSENIGNYGYSGGSGGRTYMTKMIAPKAKTLLRGIKNSVGQIIPENPTNVV